MSSHTHSLDTRAHTHTQPHASTQLSRGEPHPPLVGGVVVVPPQLPHPSFSAAIKVKRDRANETSGLADTPVATCQTCQMTRTRQTPTKVK